MNTKRAFVILSTSCLLSLFVFILAISYNWKHIGVPFMFFCTFVGTLTGMVIRHKKDIEKPILSNKDLILSFLFFILLIVLSVAIKRFVSNTVISFIGIILLDIFYILYAIVLIFRNFSSNKH